MLQCDGHSVHKNEAGSQYSIVIYMKLKVRIILGHNFLQQAFLLSNILCTHNVSWAKYLVLHFQGQAVQNQEMEDKNKPLISHESLTGRINLEIFGMKTEEENFELPV